IAAFEKLPGPRTELARIREKVRQYLGEADGSATASAIGAPLAGMGARARDDIQGKITLTPIALWNDPSAAMGQLTKDDLFQAESQFWNVTVQAMQTDDARLRVTQIPPDMDGHG